MMCCRIIFLLFFYTFNSLSTETSFITSLYLDNVALLSESKVRFYRFSATQLFILGWWNFNLYWLVSCLTMSQHAWFLLLYFLICLPVILQILI